MATKTNHSKRPLSPHLQIYRLPMTAKMSISHRLTGVVLALGTVLLTAWLVAAAMGEDSYNSAMTFAQGPLGKIILVGWSLALYYHLCNGIRHLFWDAGLLLSESSAKISGWIVILLTLILTMMTWLCSCTFF